MDREGELRRAHAPKINTKGEETQSPLRISWKIHEIKKMLTWKKSYHKPDSILKSRDIVLWTKVCIVKTMGFPVVKYTRENWTMQKVLDSRRSNQSILRNQPWIFTGRADAEVEAPKL